MRVQFPISRIQSYSVSTEVHRYTLNIKAPQLITASVAFDESDSHIEGPHWSYLTLEFEEAAGPPSRMLVGKDGQLLAYHVLDGYNGGVAVAARACAQNMSNYISWSSGTYTID